MQPSEIAKELTVALINRANIPGKTDDDQYVSKWVAKSYKIIRNAVMNPELEKD